MCGSAVKPKNFGSSCKLLVLILSKHKLDLLNFILKNHSWRNCYVNSETDAPKVFLGEDAEPDDFYANDILDSEGATDDNMRATTASTSPRSRGTVRSRDASSRGSRWSEDDGTVPESVDTQSSHSILEG